jgi:hypothetical protein
LYGKPSGYKLNHLGSTREFEWRLTMQNDLAAGSLRLTATLLLATGSLVAQVDVLTRHNDNARTGSNLAEMQLNPGNVNKTKFGKLAFRTVDGNVYAQPLIFSQAKVQGRPSPVNVLLVATEHNSVYAFDGDDISNQTAGTAKLWQVDSGVLGEHVESIDLANDIKDPGCVDLTTEVGITSTPIIKVTKASAPKEGVVFVVAKSKSAAGIYSYTLFALSVADGQKIGSAVIQGSVLGTGAGSSAGKVSFDPKFQLNRPALLLNGNTLYVAFGGHCDQPPYHGWVFAYDVSNAAAPKLLDVFCSTPNGNGPANIESRGGIWMSGEGPAVDSAGNVYFVTGDGTFHPPTDFGDSVVKMKLSGGKLQVDDWFTPQNQEDLKDTDTDLGSGGVLLLPNSHLLLSGGKEGRLYLIDRDHMGKGASPSLQSFQVTHDVEHNPLQYYNLHGNPVIWPRAGETFVYINGEENPLKQYRLIPDTTPGGQGWKFESTQPFKNSMDCSTKPNCVSAPYPNFPTGEFGRQGRERVDMPGGFLSLSANGAANGILWVTMPFSTNANHLVVGGVLRALDASDVSRDELWDSENTGNDNDHLGQFAKFCPPTVANGKVYVATFQQEVIGNDGIHRKVQGGDQPAVAIYGLR